MQKIFILLLAPLFLYSKLISINSDINVEIINDRISSDEAKRVIEYSKIKYKQNKVQSSKEAVKALLLVNQYNDNQKLLSEIYLLLSKNYYNQRYYKYDQKELYSQNKNLFNAIEWSKSAIDKYFYFQLNKDRQYHKNLIDIFQKETQLIEQKFNTLHNDKVFKGLIETPYFQSYYYLVTKLKEIDFNKKELKQINSIYSRFLKLVNKNRITTVKETSFSNFSNMFQYFLFDNNRFETINREKAYLIDIFISDFLSKGYYSKFNYFKNVMYKNNENKFVNHYTTPFKSEKIKDGYNTKIEDLDITFIYLKNNCKYDYIFRKATIKTKKINRGKYIRLFTNVNCPSIEIDVKFNYKTILHNTKSKILKDVNFNDLFKDFKFKKPKEKNDLFKTYIES
ncbi:MAG: hypothetical protein U9N59_09010 [Campylobacterota bacterium]|nr:hypothetical protein [Campylobacterota bacterium]